ncbi:MAG: KpsF/GutQ family sugar-phosphate isomerase [Gammaproteobacteria bacterium]|nr:KpsF/GutQ family sugar-phosphate isomerase [Gammaproteobacteria bacterium]MDH3577087.1 KpsF/GutQ family sugar-phosphate isomerase [Gammaproteobacteria bacterium]
MLTNDELLALAAEVLDIESRAVKNLKSRLNDDFVAACRLCMDTPGRVVVTGMGKSGHVSNKIAATLASTGTPAFFMHPAEASHGDVGMITKHDLLLAVSYSGETEEIITILPVVKRMGAKLLAITGNPNSTVAKTADVHLDISVAEEACPLNLAPTASTTAMLAMGDALAVALLKNRGFTAEDFARSHPSGNLGKRLLLRVADVMRSGDRIPAISADVTLRDALFEMTDKGLGMTAIVDANNKVMGIYTDGDLRRTLDTGADVRSTAIRDVMHTNCKTISPDVLAAEALHLLEEYKITSLLVVDESDTLVGALNIHDLFREGLM